jgi:hypothetical protein
MDKVLLVWEYVQLLDLFGSIFFNSNSIWIYFIV